MPGGDRRKPTAVPIVHARDGRVLGPGGIATRNLLMETLYDLLATGGCTWRRVSAIEVARTVGVSAGTFFQYFGELEDAFDEMYDTRRTGRRPITENVHDIARLRARETGTRWIEPQYTIDFEESHA
jgi:AcrR family transcriptional regulator